MSDQAQIIWIMLNVQEDPTWIWLLMARLQSGKVIGHMALKYGALYKGNMFR